MIKAPPRITFGNSDLPKGGKKRLKNEDKKKHIKR